MQVFAWKSDKHYFYAITLSYKKYVEDLSMSKKSSNFAGE